MRLTVPVYNESVAAAQDYVRQGKAIILSPDDTCGVSTLKRIGPPYRGFTTRAIQTGIDLVLFYYL